MSSQRDATSSDVTRLLLEWSDGEASAAERLMPLIHDELHRLAESHMRRERADHALQPTALVHEAYLRLVDQDRLRWKNRAQFFGIAARSMRRILVDHARRHRCARRPDPENKVALDPEAADETIAVG